MNTTSLPLIASQMLNTPLLLDPHKAEVLLSVFGSRIGVDAPAVDSLQENPEMSAFIGERRAGGAYRIKDGVAIVPVRGTLVNRGAWVGSSSGLTSYEGIRQSLTWAVQDPDVSKIVLDIDTPGGEASGIGQIASFIREIRSQKPVIAVVNDMAASGGYAIAAQADKILVTETSAVGSIGVVLVHIDKSAAIEAAGLKPTIIHAGKHKADGHPFAPLPEDVRDIIQEGVDGIYTLFVDLVVEGRPTLTTQAVKDTEAQVYRGQAAIDNGLADAFGTIGDAIVMDMKDGNTMPDQPNNAGANAISQEALGASVAQAREDGEKAATKRIGAILQSPEAQGREALANHYAFKTTLSSEDAIAAMAVAEKSTEEPQTSHAGLEAAARLAGEGAASIVAPDGSEAVAQPAKSMSDVYAKWN